VQYGAELGYGPMVSLQNISIIQGKPACDAKFLLALMLNDGWRYKAKQSDEKACVLEFQRGEEKHEISYSIEEAKQAGLTTKDNWKKYPADMLFSRCVSRAHRRISPQTALGLYTVEEMEWSGFQGADKARNITPPPHEEATEAPEKAPEEKKPDKTVSKDLKEDQGLYDRFKAVLLPMREVVEAKIKDKLPEAGEIYKADEHYLNSIGSFLGELGCGLSEKVMGRMETDEGLHSFIDQYVQAKVNKIKKEKSKDIPA